MGKWIYYRNKNKSFAPAKEAGHHWGVMSCGVLQGWKGSAVVPTMALTQEGALWWQRKGSVEQPSTQSYKAKLFSLMNLMWPLNSIPVALRSENKRDFTVWLNLHNNHKIESRLTVICQIWGELCPRPWNTSDWLSSMMLLDNCWLCLPFISCLTGLIVLWKLSCFPSPWHGNTPDQLRGSLRIRALCLRLAAVQSAEIPLSDPTENLSPRPLFLLPCHSPPGAFIHICRP